MAPGAAAQKPMRTFYPNRPRDIFPLLGVLQDGAGGQSKVRGPNAATKGTCPGLGVADRGQAQPPRLPTVSKSLPSVAAECGRPRQPAPAHPLPQAAVRRSRAQACPREWPGGRAGARLQPPPSHYQENPRRENASLPSPPSPPSCGQAPWAPENSPPFSGRLGLQVPARLLPQALGQ